MYLSTLGLQFDYFKYSLLPLRKRKKFMEMAKVLEEAKLKLAEAVGPMALMFGK
jgi:hypothetical protein